jgi:hypothetical protein
MGYIFSMGHFSPRRAKNDPQIEEKYRREQAQVGYRTDPLIGVPAGLAVSWALERVTPSCVTLV